MVGRSAAPSRRRPRPLVALPWGSRSTTSTRFSEAASEAARFTAVVVLPTPPFWFATARIRAMAPSAAVREGAAVTRARAGDQPAPDQLDRATPTTILLRGSDNRSLRRGPPPPLFHVERAQPGLVRCEVALYPAPAEGERPGVRPSSVIGGKLGELCFRATAGRGLQPVPQRARRS